VSCGAGKAKVVTLAIRLYNAPLSDEGGVLIIQNKGLGRFRNITPVRFHANSQQPEESLSAGVALLEENRQ